MDLTDQELLEGVRGGNLPSLAALVRRYARPLLAFFYFLSWDRHRAEDSVQEIFRVFWNNRRTRRPIGVVKLSLFQSAVELQKLVVSDESSGHEDLEIDWTHPFWAAYLQPPEWDQEEQGEWAEEVKKALKEIPEKERTPLVLHRYAGLKLSEISEILDEPEGALREVLHDVLDRTAASFSKDNARPPSPCAESPPGFPLPSESVSPGDHADGCPACSRRMEALRDVWEHLADLEIPPLREGLWPELKKTLVSGMKVRIAYPTGRLPKPLPEAVRISRRTSRFWMRFTTVASVVLAIISLYVLVVPSREGSRTTEPPVKKRSGDPRDGPVVLSTRVPKPAPPPFLLEGGAPDRFGTLVTFRGFGTQPVDCSVFRVEDMETFLRECPDVTRPRLSSDALMSALGWARREGAPQSGSLGFRLVSRRPVAFHRAGIRSPGHESIRLDVWEPGLYLIEARRGDFVAYALKVAGTLEILCRRSLSGVLACVTDASGHPVAGVTVEGYAEGQKILPSHRTADTVKFEGVPDAAPLVLLAKAGKDLALAVLEALPAQAMGAPWVLLDRSITSPGDSFRYLGFLPASTENAQLTLRDSEVPILQNRIFLFRSGLFHGSITVPPLQALSRCTVEAVHEGDLLTRRPIRVSGRAETVEFTAAPEKKTMIRGKKPVYHVGAIPPEEGTAAYLPFAFRLLHLAEGKPPSVLHEGAGRLDGAGRGVLRSPKSCWFGRVVLEMGPAHDRLLPITENEILEGPWVASLDGEGGFAEVGDPFKAVLTLRDAEGEPVKGAEIRSFVVDAPFSINTGKEGRTDDRGRLVMEILFHGKGHAELKAVAYGEGGRESRATLRIPVSDGTRFEKASPIFRTRPCAGGVRVLIRGFGSPLLLTRVDRKGNLARVPVRGEVVELKGVEIRWLYVDSVHEGNHLHARLDPSRLGAPRPFRLETPPSPWPSGKSQVVKLKTAEAYSAKKPMDFAVISSRISGMTAPLVPPEPGGPSTVSAVSSAFRSLGIPEVGRFRFKRSDPEDPIGERDVPYIVEEWKAGGATASEIDFLFTLDRAERERFLALENRVALEEVRERIKRGTPFPIPKALHPRPDRVRAPLPGLPSSARAGQVSWLVGRTRAEGAGEARIHPGHHTGRLHLVALAVDGREWFWEKATIDIVPSSSLHLHVPSFLRPGDDAVVRAVFHNRDDGPLKGTLHLAWPGGSLEKEEALTVGPGASGAVIFPFRAAEEGDRIHGTFKAGSLSFSVEEPLTVGAPKPVRFWRFNGVQEGKGWVNFKKPDEVDPASATVDWILARNPRDVLLQCLTGMESLDVPDSLSLAGKIHGFAAAWRACGGKEGELHKWIQAFRPVAVRAMEDLQNYQTETGGFSRGRGGVEDHLATAAVVDALADAKELLEWSFEERVASRLAAKMISMVEKKVGNEDARAYLVQALAGMPGEKGVEKAFQTGFTGAWDRLSPQTLARLCLAMKRAGREEERSKLASALRDCIWLHRGRIRFLRLEGPGRGESDPVIVAGLVLQALAPFPADDPLPGRLFRFLLDRRVGTTWGSPFRSGIVAAGLAQLAGPPGNPVPFTVEMNGRFETTATWEEGGAVISIPGEALWEGENFLVPPDTGDKPCIWTLVLKSPLPDEPKSDPSVAFGFLALEEKEGRWRVAEKEISPSQGSPVLGRIRLTLREPLEEVLITAHFPAGVVPLSEPRWVFSGAYHPVPSTCRIERDRMTLFLPRLPAGTTVLDVPGIASWKGRYTAPPLEVRGLSRGEAIYSSPLTLQIE
jgi:RNA polymerase sigma-70 factor (ECF subfamily)